MSQGIMVSKKPDLLTAPTLKNNFGLSKNQFDIYVSKLKNGDESLITHIVENHFRSCIYYLTYNCKITEEKAYDVCLDTMLVFRNKILDDKITYGNLTYLFTRMAKNIHIDIQKNNKKVDCAVNHFAKAKDSYKENEQHFFELLDSCVNELDKDNLKLLKEIYYSDKDIYHVAKVNNISYPTLRKRKQRMIKKLKNIFINKLNK